MKKIFNMMMATAIAAFTFTACEDVPEPYNNPYDGYNKNQEPEVVIEPAGTGTLEDPYNVAKALEVCAEVGETGTTEEVYAKGVITSITELSTSYGNATFMISDDIKANNSLTVYRAKGLENQPITDENLIAKGDTVIICGKLVNFKSNTPEFTQGCYIVSITKGEGGGEEQAAPGTQDAPLTVAEALAYIDNLGADNQSPTGYVKGKIVKISEIDTGNYGNATYTISDDGKDANTLQIYRGYSLGGEKFKSADEIKAGDDVIVTGKLINYKGNTKQFAQGSSIYSLNGNTAGGGNTSDISPKGTGTAEDPYNVAKALEVCTQVGETGTANEVYTEGIITSISDLSTQYGNATFMISDDEAASNKLTVYRAYSLNKEKFTAEDEIKVGDKVVIVGKLVNFKGSTPEYTQGCYIYKLNNNGGGGSEQPGGNGEGKGTADDPYNVTAAIAAGSGTGVFVKAFIVGSVSGQVLSSGATFSATSDTQSNILIAASADETDVAKCMPVQLPTGAVRTALNLKDNAGNYKKEVTLYGNIEKYFGATGLKSVTFAILDGKEIGTNPNGGGGDTPQVNGTGTLENPLTASQAYDAVAALTADETSTADYYVKGKITSIKYTFSAQYGTATFNISDDGKASEKEFIVYSCYYFDNQPWVEGNTQIQVGDEVVVCGKVINYKGTTPEFASKKSYLVKLNNNNGGGTSTASGTGTIDNPLTASQAYEAVAAMTADETSTDDYYVKGKITSIKYTFSAQYGTATFNISDDGKASEKEFIAYSCYYFGNQPWVEGNTQIQVGDEVVICGKVINYKGSTPEFASKKNYLVKLNTQTSASRRR